MAANEREAKFDQRHAEELGAKRYAFKQLKQWGINFGFPIIGAGAGFGIGSLFRKSKPLLPEMTATALEELPSLEQNVIKLGSKVTKAQAIVAASGAVVGVVVAGLVELYEHWRQVESARLAAAEVNEDVSNMKIRMRTDPELLRENDRLRQMLEAEEQKTAKLGGAKPTAHALHESPAQSHQAHLENKPTNRLHASSIEPDARVVDATGLARG